MKPLNSILVEGEIKSFTLEDKSRFTMSFFWGDENNAGKALESSLVIVDRVCKVDVGLAVGDKIRIVGQLRYSKDLSSLILSAIHVEKKLRGY